MPAGRGPLPLRAANSAQPCPTSIFAARYVSCGARSSNDQDEGQRCSGSAPRGEPRLGTQAQASDSGGDVRRARSTAAMTAAARIGGPVPREQVGAHHGPRCSSRDQSRARARSDQGSESNRCALPDYALSSSLELVAAWATNQQSRLVELDQPGSPEAFAVFLRPRRASGYFASRTKDAEVAADFTAEVFAAALGRGASHGASPSSLSRTSNSANAGPPLASSSRATSTRSSGRRASASNRDGSWAGADGSYGAPTNVTRRPRLAEQVILSASAVTLVLHR
jgi:hypothetical protein